MQIDLKAVMQSESAVYGHLATLISRHKISTFVQQICGRHVEMASPAHATGLHCGSRVAWGCSLN